MTDSRPSNRQNEGLYKHGSMVEVRREIGRCCWMGVMAPFAGARVTSGALAADTNHGFIRTALSI